MGFFKRLSSSAGDRVSATNPAHTVDQGAQPSHAGWRDCVPVGVPEHAAPLMVTLPKGKFLMGSSAEVCRNEPLMGSPAHKVRINYALAVGKYQVTFAEWDAALALNADLHNPKDEGWGRDQRPVINVSWLDAQEYISWLNEKLGLSGRGDAYRLPSEAEWEYACRAGTTTLFSCGTTVSTKQAHYSERDYGSATQTVPVGSFPANAFGLNDMHGNVWEWCEDVWHYTYKGAPSNGSPWVKGGSSVVTLTAPVPSGTYYLLRGGSWSVVAKDLRSAYRNYQKSERFRDRGFRLARTMLPR